MLLTETYFTILRKFFKTYSLFFVVVFLTAIGLQSTHFLQHADEDLHCCHHHHDCDDSQSSEDCNLCDFTFSFFTDSDLKLFTPQSFFTDYHYTDFGLSLNLKSIFRFNFSLRSPPLN